MIHFYILWHKELDTANTKAPATVGDGTWLDITNSEDIYHSQKALNFAQQTLMQQNARKCCYVVIV